MGPRKTCAVLVPVAASMEPETEAGLRELANRGYVVRTLRGSSQVDLARSMLATQALADGFAETFWIDSDIAFDPDDVDRLRGHNRPLTAGLYVKKGKQEFAAKFHHAGAMTLGQGGGLVEMEYVGMGFTHVRAEVYATVARELALPLCGGGYEGRDIVPYFLPLLVPEGERLGYLSEDYSFCHRARSVGFPAFADTTIKLGHLGRYRYTWEDLFPKQAHESIAFTIEDPGDRDCNPNRPNSSRPSPGEHEESKGNDAMSPYEKIGQLQMAFDQLDAQYTGLLTLLAQVVSGEVDRSRILVNLTDRSWVKSEPGTRPAMPATINGLPAVVVAPEEPAPAAPEEPKPA